MYDLWKGIVMMFKPSCCACNIPSTIACDLCPFKIKRWKFVSKIPKGTYVLKKIKKFLEHECCHPNFLLYGHVGL
jgi:hypothetical protein